MFFLFFLFVIAIGVASVVLLMSKNAKAEEIKTLLAEILVNLKALFSNLKSLFIILKDLVVTEPAETQSTVDNNDETNQNQVENQPSMTQEVKKVSTINVDNQISETTEVESSINPEPPKDISTTDQVDENNTEGDRPTTTQQIRDESNT